MRRGREHNNRAKVRPSSGDSFDLVKRNPRDCPLYALFSSEAASMTQFNSYMRSISTSNHFPIVLATPRAKFPPFNSSH